MGDFFRWFHEFSAKTDWQATFTGLALIVSLAALIYSRRSNKAAERSADAAEDSNKHAHKSAEAAEVSSTLARAGFENEAKRVKASAYWTLYRIHKNLREGGRAGNCDPSPIRDMLAVYGDKFTLDERSTLNKVLAAIENMMAAPMVLKVETDRMDPQLVAAMVILKEDWMANDAIQHEEKS